MVATYRNRKAYNQLESVVPVIGTFLAVYVTAIAVLYAMAIQELLSRV